jgi:GNAT superfamily N-acetyltransferase
VTGIAEPAPDAAGPGPAAGPSLYAGNAAAMWASLPGTRPLPGPPQVAVTDVPAHPMIRVIIGRPLSRDPGGRIAALLARPPAGGRVAVEDSFGTLRLPAGDGVIVDRMPLMSRPPGPAGPAAPPAGISVERALDEDRVAAAERVIVEGFPRRTLLPYRQGQALPPGLAAVPGWQVWLACRDGEPAAACCTYDDGRSLSVNWLATMPAHRSLGLGRLVMNAALGAAQDLPATLVATDAGVPLYESLGFRTAVTAVWYRRLAAPPG